MGFCFPKNDSRSTLGIPQSSADSPFLSKTFNAIAKKATQKQKGKTAEAEALKARHKENRYERSSIYGLARECSIQIDARFQR
jgi:hypothetical protein